MRYLKDDKGNRNGHVCPRCGQHHTWGAYVFAHWDVPLVFTCPAPWPASLPNPEGEQRKCGWSATLRAGKLTRER